MPIIEENALYRIESLNIQYDELQNTFSSVDDFAVNIKNTLYVLINNDQNILPIFDSHLLISSFFTKMKCFDQCTRFNCFYVVFNHRLSEYKL
ncbi:hypothetical protein BpHYR1_047453 [Brachionus plicatilis]|uniref:Uncharacterized protein n=1 Tax=Brachionus plicatilis TaxID=10195 RepID=A0A3M7PSQ3_BRAPC|nr:hypothetical protein BpHYR1_047453 [Brachionus plicatilis]